MDKFYVLKNTKTGKYYSDDKVFIEPIKNYAKRLRLGQARSIMWEHHRFAKEPYIIMEPVD